jgi:multidrug resistance efflux pump
LENPNLVEVSILLDQIDVVNVKPGMKVEVVLDAYPGETFEGVLGDIDSTPTTTNGVVSYTVKVSIDK